MKMNGKVVISAVSLILVVGAVVGTVMVVNNNNSSSSGVSSSNQKSVRTMCQNTEERKLCQDTLGNVKDSSDPKAYLIAAVEAATKNVIKAFNMTQQIFGEYEKDNGMKMALEDCKEMLDFATDSLQFSIDLLRNNTVQTVNDRSPDFRNWMSAVVSYQQGCLDGFEEGKDVDNAVKSQLQQQGLDEMGKLSIIVLNIMADFTSILQKFGVKVESKPASRRLLWAEVDNEGYPTWFPSSDRVLVEKMGRGHHIKPNVVVAQDGSGQFKTINDAIKSHPGMKTKGFHGRYIIFVKAGIYKEYVIIPKQAENILMYGQGIGKTIVTGNKNYIDGVTSTMQTATFSNTAIGFIAKRMTFENTAGPVKHQAVALRSTGDMSAFFDCAMVGFQDTLYAQSNRQFYRNCDIAGTVDFIFGTSPMLIQSSRIIVRRPGEKQFNTVTADGTTDRDLTTGIVIQNCDIIPEAALFPDRFTVRSYLGRPWKARSKTVIMESRIGDLIHPDGWAPWDGNKYLDTLYYAEYNNQGPGANVQRRIRWPGYKGLISKNEAAKFTATQFLNGGPQSSAAVWLKALHVPYDISFTKP